MGRSCPLHRRMEASALRYSGGIGLQGRSPLLRLQSDERLISMVRRGSPGAFEVLVARYQGRLLAFCRHLLGSREDAEDVLQEVMAAAFNAILADERPINVRPWLYRIARNRCLNHLRRIQAVGVDSMDIHLSEHGVSTADKVHGREEFRMLVDDIQRLPETQRTALVLREMDALSYEQIAEAMETTVPSVKSLLVRARVSLAEAAEARLLSCEGVRVELGEIAEGLHKKSAPLVRRHLRSCRRCSTFNTHLKRNNKALTAVLPIGPLVLLRKLAITHIGHSAGAGSSAAGTSAAGQAAALGSSAAAGGTAMLGSGAGGIVSVSIGTIATKAAAGLAAAALVTAGAVEVTHTLPHHRPGPVAQTTITSGGVSVAGTSAAAVAPAVHDRGERPALLSATKRTRKHKLSTAKKTAVVQAAVIPASTRSQGHSTKPTVPPGRTQTQPVGTVLPTTTTDNLDQHTKKEKKTTTGTPTTTTTPVTTTTPATTTTTNGTTTTPISGSSTAPSWTPTPAPTAIPPLSGSKIRGAPRHERHERGAHRRHHEPRPTHGR